MKAQSRYSVPQRDRGAYAEVCGRMRSLEKRLLGWARLEELLAAGDWPGLLSILLRSGYLSRQTEQPELNWDQALTMSLRESDRSLLAMDPQPLVMSLLVLHSDLLNLRSVLKAKVLSRPFSGHWHPRGIHSYATLQALVNTMNFSVYPPLLAEELCTLKDVLASKRLLTLNLAVDIAHHRALLRASRQSGSRLFLDYLGHLADLVNIKNRFRTLAFSEAWPEDPPPLPGGHLGVKLLAGLPDQEALLGELARTVYGPLLEKSRGDGGNISPLRLEKEGDNFLTELIQPAKYVTLGPEPLWAYYLARETDAKNVRALILGTLSGREPEAIRAGLRRPYV